MQWRRRPGRTPGGAPLIRRHRRLPWIPTEEQWLALLQVMQQTSTRTRLMFAMSYDAALRQQELVTLDTTDIDPAHRLIRIRAEHAKNRCERVVPYTASTGQLYSSTFRDDAPSAALGVRCFYPCRIATPAERSASGRGPRPSPGSLASLACSALPPTRFATCASPISHEPLDIHEIATFAGHRSLASTLLHPFERSGAVIEAPDHDGASPCLARAASRGGAVMSATGSTARHAGVRRRGGGPSICPPTIKAATAAPRDRRVGQTREFSPATGALDTPVSRGARTPRAADHRRVQLPRHSNAPIALLDPARRDAGDASSSFDVLGLVGETWHAIVGASACNSKRSLRGRNVDRHSSRSPCCCSGRFRVPRRGRLDRVALAFRLFGRQPIDTSLARVREALGRWGYTLETPAQSSLRLALCEVFLTTKSPPSRGHHHRRARRTATRHRVVALNPAGMLMRLSRALVGLGMLPTR